MNLEELKIYVVSDSLGETGEIVVRAAIAQFKTDNYKIKRNKQNDIMVIVGRDKCLKLQTSASQSNR